MISCFALRHSPWFVWPRPLCSHAAMGGVFCLEGPTHYLLHYSNYNPKVVFQFLEEILTIHAGI